MSTPQQAAAQTLAASASSSNHDDTDMYAPAEGTSELSDDFGDDKLIAALTDKLMEIAAADEKKDERLNQLKRALVKRKEAVDQAAKLRNPAMQPKADAALIAAADQLKSSQSDAMAQRVEKLMLKYATPTPGEQQVQEAEQAAETTKQVAKQALLGFEEARATVATAEGALARIQQSLAGDDSASDDAAASDSGEEVWRAKADRMASMLDLTFLDTGSFSREKINRLRTMGAWFCDELKLWYVADGKEKERGACLAVWPENVLSFEQFRILLARRFGWSDK